MHVCVCVFACGCLRTRGAAHRAHTLVHVGRWGGGGRAVYLCTIVRRAIVKALWFLRWWVKVLGRAHVLMCTTTFVRACCCCFGGPTEGYQYFTQTPPQAHPLRVPPVNSAWGCVRAFVCKMYLRVGWFCGKCTLTHVLIVFVSSIGSQHTCEWRKSRSTHTPRPPPIHDGCVSGNGNHAKSRALVDNNNIVFFVVGLRPSMSCRLAGTSRGGSV